MIAELTRSRTPWLTTRRRTCPICKGDVVRSLARVQRSAATAGQNGLSSPSPVHDSFRDDDDSEAEIFDADDVEAAENTNARAMPSRRPTDHTADVEAAADARRARGWRARLSSSLGAVRGSFGASRSGSARRSSGTATSNLEYGTMR
jgi:hypothetical protein